MMTKTILLTLFIFLSSAVNSKDVNVTRYGDRVFVTNFLIDIYGEVSRKIVEKEIFNKPSLFGGPCDPYSQTLKEDQKNRDSYKVLGGNERCIKDFFPEYTTSIILENSVLRSSALSSVCKKLSLCEKCMEYALKRIGLTFESPRTVENSKKVYRQFYPFSESEFKSYEKIFVGNSKHSWPFTFELFCKTEEWQIP